MSIRGIRFSFEPGECVLCFEPDPTKARVIYEAKILDTAIYKDEDGKRRPGYHIHFLRWNNSWDRLVGEQLVLKSNEENRFLMKQLSDVAKKNCKNKIRRRMIHSILKAAFEGKNPFENDPEVEGTGTTDTDESSTETESVESDSKTESDVKHSHHRMSFDVEIPDALCSVLDRDYFAVNQDRKFVKLPAEVNVVTVLESFVKTFMMEFWSPNFDRAYLCHNPPKIAIERILPICKEFVDGLRICFDFILPTVLLYEPEKEQYHKLMSVFTHKSPAKQKTVAEDSPLLKSPRSKATPSSSASTDEPCPKLPKYSPSSPDDDDEITFNPNSTGFTPRRVTRSRADSHKKLDDDKGAQRSSDCSDLKDEKVEDIARQIRKRRSSERQDDGLRRRALRSYRKSSEGSTESDDSQTDTIMSEPVKAIKTESDERPPPLLFPCNLMSGSHHQNGAEKGLGAEKGAPGSTDSTGDTGREILATIMEWKLLPEDVVTRLPTPPSLMYGSQHLLRLFVKLPELLTRMEIDDNKMGVLKKLTQQLLIYLSEHVDYLSPDAAYISSCDV